MATSHRLCAVLLACGVGCCATQSLGFGSCLHHDRRPWTIFNEVAAFTKLDRFLHLGDLIYADWSSTNSSEGDDISLLNEMEYVTLLNGLYSDAFSDGPLSSLMSEVKFHFMWDDHEIYDNYDEGTGTAVYTSARQVFNEHVAWRNPPPRRTGELYFNFTFDQGSASVFVLDTRSFRSRKNMSDDGVRSKTMLGGIQLEALKAWLVQTPQGHYKIIASSVMWNDQAGLTDYLDGWAHYQRERTDLFEFVNANSIANVVLISGDAHWSGAFYFPQHGIHEFSVSPLAAPAMACYDCPTIDAQSSLASVAEFVASEVEGLLGVITIDPEALVFEMVQISTSSQQTTKLHIKKLPRILPPSFL